MERGRELCSETMSIFRYFIIGMDIIGINISVLHYWPKTSY
jgi:hypothetical protein